MERHADYLLCFDSDGTIMDTMTVKHRRAFAPAFIEEFGISHHAQEITDHWLKENLYTKTRGMNRFQGLDEILRFSEGLGYSFPGREEFSSWVNSTPTFSMDLLQIEMESHPENLVFAKAYSWSKKVNALIALLPPSHPFDGVKEVLRQLRGCDLLGVSSANAKAVKEEWEKEGIYSLFMGVMTQEDGTKSEIIAKALTLGYDPSRVVMVGDALGDYQAAKKNRVSFYPIFPKKEAESWRRFIDEVYVPLTKGEYEETPYVNAFLEALQ